MRIAACYAFRFFNFGNGGSILVPVDMLDKYNYNLSPWLIVQQPADPRDSSKILVYKKDTNEVFFDVFANVLKYVPERTLFVFNKTKVIPARLPVVKETGGRAELLFVETRGEQIICLGSKPLKIGSSLRLDHHKLVVEDKVSKYYSIRPDFANAKLFDVLEQHGKTPLPPYIKQCPLSEQERKQKYQTVFAEDKGSIAAPTASLHFTDRLLDKIDKVFVTLHVNQGTFAPVTDKQIQEGKLHKEWYEVSEKAAEKINRAKKEDRPIIAVGTTAMRTLESAAKNGQMHAGAGVTDLFIQPGYQFQITQNMITNFHVPKSSLMMLVASLVGREKLLDLYQQAIDRKMRFYSFGDAMIII